MEPKTVLREYSTLKVQKTLVKKECALVLVSFISEHPFKVEKEKKIQQKNSFIFCMPVNNIYVKYVISYVKSYLCNAKV